MCVPRTTPNDPSSATRPTRAFDCNRDAMALLGICHRTIHTNQRPQNKAFLLRKPLPAAPASFGERFRVARVGQGHTQTEMARKFGVSLSAIKFWEQDRTHPDTAVRTQIKVFLNARPLDNLLKAKRGTSIDCRVGNLPSTESTDNPVSVQNADA